MMVSDQSEIKNTLDLKYRCQTILLGYVTQHIYFKVRPIRIRLDILLRDQIVKKNNGIEMTNYKVITELHLNGCSPQKVIRMMNDIINRTPVGMRRYLVIEEYGEDYGHPFREPDKCLRVILKYSN